MVDLLIKRFVSAVISVAIGLSIVNFEANALDISAQSAVVVNCDTGEVVFSKNADEKRPMASTTKIMTSLLAVESGKLDDFVSINNDTVIEGTSAGLKKGYKYKLIDLVYAMMLESGNDAAYAVACYLCGSEKDFSLLMNRKAEDIGMHNTNFVTASGLDAENHYSTAYDMALLGCYTIKNDTFREVCSTKSKNIALVKPDIVFNYSNHNKLLGNLDGAIGIKTGFTKKSGRCLVSACERNSVRYVAVTLNAPDDWNDHEKLYSYAYERTKISSLNLNFPRKISVYSGTESYLELSTDSVRIPYIRMSDYEYKVVLPHFLYAPIKKGDVVGRIVLRFSDGMMIETNITATKSIDVIGGREKPSSILIRLIRKIFT